MSPRLFVHTPLLAGCELELPADAARHAQVLRVQPGSVLTLFDGGGSDWTAEVLAMGRQSVVVRVGAAQPVALELPRPVTLALAVPANDRMDALVEKATELGAAGLQPLLSERSVLRLDGERAERKRVHWQAVAVAACEQCGRARVPVVAPVRTLAAWLRELPPAVACRLLLSLGDDACTPAGLDLGAPAAPLCTLSGPEGGLSADEEQAARRAGFVAVSLGPRVLRADTAPLALLAWLALQVNPPRSGPGRAQARG